MKNNQMQDVTDKLNQGNYFCFFTISTLSSNLIKDIRLYIKQHYPSCIVKMFKNRIFSKALLDNHNITYDEKTQSLSISSTDNDQIVRCAKGLKDTFNIMVHVMVNGSGYTTWIENAIKADNNTKNALLMRICGASKPVLIRMYQTLEKLGSRS